MSQFRRSLERQLADPEFRAGYDESRDRRKLIGALVAWRKETGLSQQEVAGRMGVGQSTVSQFEGSADPRLSTIQRYARAVGARPSFFLTPRIEAKQWVTPSFEQPARAVWKPASTPTPSRSRSAFAKAA